MIKIDIFSHILTKRFYNAFMDKNPDIGKDAFYISRPTLSDLDTRARWMRRYPDVLQVISMVNLLPEDYFTPSTAVELCRLGNEELAEVVAQRPDLFYGAVGMLPMSDTTAAVEMIDYCVGELGLLGVQLFTRILGKTLASPEYRPIFARMAALDKPIWLHPVYDRTRDDNNLNFSWEYELSQCMLALVESDLFLEFPDIKIIVHHAGAMVPFYSDRIKFGTPFPYSEHYKRFYVDTSIYGNLDGLMNVYKYYGADHVFFGTDSPLGPPPGGVVEDTILAIEKMSIPEEDRLKIFRNNAINLFKLSI